MKLVLLCVKLVLFCLDGVCLEDIPHRNALYQGKSYPDPTLPNALPLSVFAEVVEALLRACNVRLCSVFRKVLVLSLLNLAEEGLP